MDRFKFRAWDIEEQKYREVIALGQDRSFLLNIGHVRNDTQIFEQCTGLKDKNGKLIYEGDIIELTRARNYGYIPKGSRLIIKWNTFDCCGFSTGIRGNLTKKCADNCIVIGNIHENKDLLGE